MEDVTKNRKNNPRELILYLFVLCVISVVVVNYLHFFKEKNFNYLIESSCNERQEVCFYRDCDSNPDECGVNTFSPYKQYYIKAYDFEDCKSNFCEIECATSIIECVPVECDISIGDTCTQKEIYQ